jgi:hypothetical protein
MSWSFSAIGTPDKIAEAIEAESEKLAGQSKLEFDEAKPHLVGLVKQNFAKDPGYSPPVMNFSASGSGSARGDEQIHRSCSVKIESMYTKLLV